MELHTTNSKAPKDGRRRYVSTLVDQNTMAQSCSVAGQHDTALDLYQKMWTSLWGHGIQEKFKTDVSQTHSSKQSGPPGAPNYPAQNMFNPTGAAKSDRRKKSIQSFIISGQPGSGRCTSFTLMHWNTEDNISF